MFGTVPLGARRLTRIGDLRAARQLDLGLGQGCIGGAPCPVLAQGGKQRLEDEIVDETRLMETHFVLGRMDVDIHLAGIQLDIKHIGREAIGGQQLVIGLANGVIDELVPHHAAIDIGVLQVVLRPGPCRSGQPAPQPHVAVFARYRQGMVHEGGAADGGKAALLLRHRVGRLVLAHHLAVVTQDQGGVEAGERDAAHQFVDVGKFGLFAAHELAPRRGVEEEIHHLHRGAHRVGRRLDGDAHLTPFRLGLPGLALLCRTGGEGEAGDGADGGERLPAKAQAVDPFQIVQGRHLGGGVARQRQHQLIPGDTAAVVTNADKLGASLVDVDLDPVSPRIQAVFHQFLHHGGGPLHHLTGSNLVGQNRRQYTDWHRLLLQMKKGKRWTWRHQCSPPLPAIGREGRRSSARAIFAEYRAPALSGCPAT